MKILNLGIAVTILLFGAVTLPAQNLDRISAETGVPVGTLQAERASTGLGWGSLENAHLLANATGQSFDDIVALHQSGQGWGKIARDNGLKLGRIVSDAHRSSQATTHAQNLNNVHGKSTTLHSRSKGLHGKNTTVHGRSATSSGRGHSGKVTSMRDFSHRSSFRSSFAGSHGMHSRGHMSGGHRMASMGHGHGRGR